MSVSSRQQGPGILQPTASRLQPVHCAVYTRKSHEDGLEQDFNSLDAQREACEAFIRSQAARGWELASGHYDDGGFSGGTMERPALKRLLKDVDAGAVDTIVVYKIDRLSRSLLDFFRMVELFEERGVSFVSVTEQFNTTDSSGRLMLGILMSFAQYEREIAGERIRDKVAAAKRHGKWCGGPPTLGYDVDRPNKRLVVNEEEARIVRRIFRRFNQTGSTLQVVRE
ncbi:MAG TPA: recombinase family protein, partial [Planctomycetes bacterium]|nr:recombinase family protein [Planctomycetota bacterium]